MNEQLFDLLVVLVATVLIGWGAYEAYRPLCPVSVGVILLSLVCMSRRAK